MLIISEISTMTKKIFLKVSKYLTINVLNLDTYYHEV